jgi:hypothetical protein
MAKIGQLNAKADLNLLKSALVRNMQAGEKQLAFQFYLKVNGFELSDVLVRTAQYPAMGYETTEDIGQQGMKFNGHGALINSGEIPLTFVETIKGDTLKFLKFTILDKQWVDIELYNAPESLGGKPAPFSSCKMLYCKLNSEGIDLDTSDGAALTNVSVTVTYNWVDHAPVAAAPTPLPG